MASTSIMDVLTSTNVLENIFAVTPIDMLATLIFSFFMGVFIMFIYGRIYQGAMYSGSFAVSLVALTMISAVLILAVTSNLVLSLGMVGALSIVRFRTAIKDPLEIVFLFWAIETGIVLATGIYPLAVIVNILIGLALVVLVVQRPEYPYILVLKCRKSALREVENKLKESTNFTVKSRKAISPSDEKNKNVITGPDTENADGNHADSRNPETLKTIPRDTVIEIDIEITLKRDKGERNTPGFDQTSFVDKLADIDGVYKAILVTYNGGYMN